MLYDLPCEDQTVVAHGCQKTKKKILCGIEGENVVAYGGLHSPARRRLNVCRDI